LDAGQRSFGSGTKTFVGSLTKDDAFTIDSATNVLWHTWSYIPPSTWRANIWKRKKKITQQSCAHAVGRLACALIRRSRVEIIATNIFYSLPHPFI
jgi:hypothetical protein